ncbi:MAG: 30S ribosome-binding factor RbfA [Erysipelotrichia bacterium]|nr:30S ribosome-binding factor RbfA [Erysipelotrichia bacterium]NCC53941.1 30S ribosome-binding factor RbfA [Erysipelotrichia bacterium]
MSKKNEKIAELIKRNISEIIQFDLKDPKIGFITITDCQVTSDLSYAKIFVSFLGQNARKEAGMQALNRSKGYLRSELSKRLSTRKVPELIFQLDDALERGNKIEKIIADMNKKAMD